VKRGTRKEAMNKRQFYVNILVYHFWQEIRNPFRLR